MTFFPPRADDDGNCPHCRQPMFRAPPLAAPAPSAMATGEFKAMADEVAKRIATEAALQRRIAWLETKVRMFDTFASAQACKSVDNAMQSRFGDSATAQAAADRPTPPAAPAAVTEAMVEAACLSLFGDSWRADEDTRTQRLQRIMMRAAIQAALAAAASAERGA